MLPNFRLILLSACFSVSSLMAIAQHNPYEFYTGSDYSGERTGGSFDISSDNYLFYLPVEGMTDLFIKMSDFNFSAVRYNLRGYGNTYSRILLDNIDISSGLTSPSEYSLTNALRRTRFAQNRVSGLSTTASNPGFVAGADQYFSDLEFVPPGNSASLSFTDRRNRTAGRIYSAGRMSKKWRYVLTVNGRWGMDKVADGVFTDEVSYLGALERDLAKGHKIRIMSTGTVSENGMRSYTVKEAFELTDDNYYNPSWGYFNGKIRNSKVKRRFLPFSILTYEGTLSAKTRLGASASYRFGKSSTSSLAWFNAETPYPDYYRYMPGYAENEDAQRIITGHWNNRDVEVTQINWVSLYEQNLMSPEDAVYILEDRVNEVSDFRAALNFHTRIDQKLDIAYGVGLYSENTQFYKKLKDLLGGSPFFDVDQYLTEDEIYGSQAKNDLRNPNRKIGEGDRFGYNYTMSGRRYEGFAMLNYNENRFGISAAFTMGNTILQRNGHYEKELYSGNLSYGKSEKLSFENYSAKLSLRYSFSPRHIIRLWGITATSPPDYGNIFVSPAYVNKVIHRPQVVNLHGIDGDYIASLDKLLLKVSGYYTVTRNETSVYGYWDDIASVYSDMILTGVDKRYCGFEIGALYEITSRLSISLAASMGEYIYASNPTVDILEDATMKPYVSNSKSYMDGYHLGNTPEKVLTAEVKYNASGWLSSLTFSYMSGRYVSPNPLRRMERAYNLAGSPERFREFISQENLNDAFTVNLFLLKSFSISKTRFTAIVSVNNLLNSTNIIYNGYEQMRILKRGTDVNRRWTPFGSKYLHSYGRTLYVSLSCRF